jgi:hypothetical protein
MRSLFLLFSFVLLTTCSGDSVDNPNCRFLLDVPVNIPINLNLPEYQNLNSIGNSIYINDINAGNKGIIVTNAGTSFLAWDASDPNHVPSNCSAVLGSGLQGTCGCGDGNTYSFVNGQPLGRLLPNGDIEPDSGLLCGLKFYRVEQSGNNLLISN